MQGAGGNILGTREFLQLLRSEASRMGAVLVFDEVVTSRLRCGGLQEYFQITPDMTTMGKHFGGRSDLSEYFTDLAPIVVASNWSEILSRILRSEKSHSNKTFTFLSTLPPQTHQ